MIKCNVTACGTIGRDASIRTNKEGKTFVTFPLRVRVSASKGQDKTIDIDVRKNGGSEDAAGYRSGVRTTVRGTMYLKRRGEKLYFNLSADRIDAAADETDAVKGEMSFRGKVGKNVEERRDRNNKPYTVFSAFSTEKVDDGFEYQWVRFFRFDAQREEWLQPGVKVTVRGEMSLTAHDGKVDLSCKAEELAPCVADSSDPNR